MRTTLPPQVTDPAAIPVGAELGEWRVLSWGGRGVYGTVYRVERRGHEGLGPYALKLALHPRDERFKREEELLARVNHPNVPRLEGHGVWQHPAGAFPYVVMQWVPGVSLYQWAAQRNPTSRQVLRVLAHVTRALEAIAAVGGVHRDVKGDNVLVRLADERAFLTDFGAGVYRGAATLTLQPLPPGTPNYRSPEAWAYQGVFAYHPLAHYRGNACDDLFALGVTAYRLVTDEYPPPTEPECEGAEVWRRRGPGPRPPRALNANVCGELNALILRLLGQPERRFKGIAQQAAEALEYAAHGAGPEADTPLFEWETQAPSDWSAEERSLAQLHGHRTRRRDKATVQCAEQMDAAAKAEAPRSQEQERAPARASPELRLVHSRARVLRLLPWVAPGIGALVLVVATRGEHEYAPPAEAQAAERNSGSSEGGTAGAAEEVLASASVDPVMRSTWGGVAVGKIKGPLSGQRRPPCPPGEDAIQGGCWRPIPEMAPPCQTGYYEWDGHCHLPVFAQARQPTSEPR